MNAVRMNEYLQTPSSEVVCKLRLSEGGEASREERRLL